MVKPDTFEGNKRVAMRGGNIAGNARKELEQEIGAPIITSQNAVQLNQLMTGMIEHVADFKEK